MLRAKQRLMIVVPLTLLIIVLIIYLNTRSAIKTAIVLLAVPFSLVGAFWILYWLGYNLSVAVWVGIIALAGLDAETGVVMLFYLDLAYDEVGREGPDANNRQDLRDAIYHGAVKRVRPKAMTVGRHLLAACCRSCVSHGRGRRRDETHRHADDRRRRDLRHHGAADLSGHLRPVEEARIDPARKSEIAFVPPGLILSAIFIT